MCDYGIRFFSLSYFQYTPDMELNKFVTLWILFLCLVEKCWTDRSSTRSPEIQVVENAVSGKLSYKLLIILIMCENNLLLYLVYPPVAFSREAPLFGRECVLFVPHLCDSAGTSCAGNSPAGSPLPIHLLKLPKSRYLKNLINICLKIFSVPTRETDYILFIN